MSDTAHIDAKRMNLGIQSNTVTGTHAAETYGATGTVDRQQYEQDLAERQRKHLESLQQPENWRPCMHDQCQICHGTGVTKNGPCVHMISCPCPKCSPQ